MGFLGQMPPYTGICDLICGKMRHALYVRPLHMGNCLQKLHIWGIATSTIGYIVDIMSQHMRKELFSQYKEFW